MFGTRITRPLTAAAALATAGLAAAACSSTNPAADAPLMLVAAPRVDPAADAAAVVTRSPAGGTIVYRLTSHGGAAVPLYVSRGGSACATCAAAADGYLKGGELQPRCDACGADRVPVARATGPTPAHEPFDANTAGVRVPGQR